MGVGTFLDKNGEAIGQRDFASEEETTACECGNEKDAKLRGSNLTPFLCA